LGNAIRVTAIKRTSPKISTGDWSANGVPGIGIKQLIGTLSGGGSKLLNTSSIRNRSFSVSPIPMMPPQQTDMPLSCTAEMVSRRS
jgi:hypothetical protein